MSTIDEQLTFDFASALTNLGGDRDLFRVLADMFAEDVPQEIAEISDSLAAQDWERLQLHAHTLKGLCSTFSAEPMRKIAQQLEAGAKAVRAHSELQQLVAELRALEQETVTKLQFQKVCFLHD